MTNNFVLNTVSRGLVILLQFVNIKLYTHYLDAAQLGGYFFLLAISYSANALIFVPLDYYQQANLARVRQASGGILPLLAFNIRVWKLYAIFSFLMTVVYAVIWPDQVIDALLIMLLAYALYVVQALRNTLNNLERRNCVSISFIQEAVLKVMIFYLLVQSFYAEGLLLMIAWLVALILTAVYLAWVAVNQHFLTGDARAVTVHGREVIRFAYPISIGAAGNWLQLQGYRIVLVPLGFAEQVGIFATIANIGSAVIGAASLIYSQQFTPQIYKTAGQYTARYLKGALALVVVISIVMLCFGELVIRMLTSPDFIKFWGLLLFGVLTDGANLLIGAMAIHVTLTNNTQKFLPTVFTGIFAMVVCFGSLYWMDWISTITIGIPLAASQWLVVLHMYLICRDGPGGLRNSKNS